MLTQNQIEQIVQLLKLEKITVLQKMTLIMFPTVQDDEFHKNINKVQIKLKKISPLIDIKIVSDAESVSIPLLQPPENIEKENT